MFYWAFVFGIGFGVLLLVTLQFGHRVSNLTSRIVWCGLSVMTISAVAQVHMKATMQPTSSDRSLTTLAVLFFISFLGVLVMNVLDFTKSEKKVSYMMRISLPWFLLYVGSMIFAFKLIY